MVRTKCTPKRLLKWNLVSSQLSVISCQPSVVRSVVSHQLSFKASLAEKSYLSNGSATPMRGKSLTCREAPKKTIAVYDRSFRVGDPIKSERPLSASRRLAAHRSGRA